MDDEVTTDQLWLAVHALARMVFSEYPGSVPYAARIWGEATDEELAALNAVIGEREYP